MHYRDAGHGSFTGALGSDEKKTIFCAGSAGGKRPAAVTTFRELRRSFHEERRCTFASMACIFNADKDLANACEGLALNMLNDA